jgi:hypothetical protein
MNRPAVAPEKHADLIRRDSAQWAQVIRRIGAKAD